MEIDSAAKFSATVNGIATLSQKLASVAQRKSSN